MSLNIGTVEQQKQVNGLDFPLVVLPPNDQVASDIKQFHAWLEAHKPELHSKLIAHGAILFRGFPVSSAEAFEAMLDQTDYENMPYVGGAAPRTQVTHSRIVTANESPATEKIPFHHEMAQTPLPPGYIFFFCEQASATGGATSILHSAEICEKFIAINPEFAAKIEQEGVRYIRYMPEVTDTGSAIGRSWKDTFQVDTPEECEARLKAAGMSWSWQPNGDLRTESDTLPAIRFDDESQQKTFFNSLIAVYTGWNDSRNIAEKAVVCGDGSFMDKAAMEKTVTAMDEMCVNFSWQNGDVLFINNHLVLHARQPFSGERSILASIAYKEAS